jgi:hypothetical protein
MHIGLLAVLALLMALPASAAADAPITVNESTDAPLAAKGESTECVSEDVAEGCTLRAAVELANEESREFGEVVTIDVPADTYDDSLGQLTIEASAQIVIAGAGAGETIIDGGEVSHVFEVDENASLTVKGVTIEQGGEDAGGGIYVVEDASVAVEDSTIAENGAGAGGGIYVSREASLTIKHSTLADNEAEYGGGIYGEQNAAITIEQSTIASNEARWGGGIDAGIGAEDACEGVSAATSPSARAGAGAAVNRASGGGGGVSANVEPASPMGGLTIKQSTIEANTAFEGNGGGIDAWRDAGCDDDLSGTHSTNSSSIKSPRPGLAIFEEEQAPGLTIEQSAIVDNTADEEDAGYAGEGGGIFEEGPYYEDPIVNSTIAGNVAQRDGGGVGTGFGSIAILISDTVFDNRVEPNEDTSAEGDAARHQATAVGHDYSYGPVAEPGNNLASEDDGLGLIELRNTIVAEPNGELDNCAGEITSLVPGAGYNLDYPSITLPDASADTCGLSASDDDLVGENPGLDEAAGLHDNGGPTQTIALLSTSPAIGFVPVKEDCEESVYGPALLDQRGDTRPGIAGDGCDIGAYEYQSQKPAQYQLSLSPPTGEDEAGTTHTHSVTATVTEEGASPAVSRAALGAVASGDVTFAIAGQNGGVTGTCTTPAGAPDPECATSSEGEVVFTYADANGAGADTITASAVLGAATEHASASMTWTAVPEQPKTVTAPSSPAVTVLPFKATSPPQCTSRRDITIHIQNVKQLGIVSAVVSVDGHHLRTLKGKHLTTAIDLVGLPKGTFTVEIVAHLRDGRTLRGERVYHTCRGTPLPGHSYLPL